MVKKIQEISSLIRQRKHFLCVGLDPDLGKMNAELLSQEKPLVRFCEEIIEQSKDIAIAYKINIAFFETLGSKGYQQLEELMELLPKECFLIADAKRADIGNTSKQYANFFFDHLNFDAITLHPYMGVDSLEPFLQYENKVSIILALTSNPGAIDFELQEMKTGGALYKQVISTFSNSPFSDRIMFVVGATRPQEFVQIRQWIPHHFLLVPGVGEQGGDLESTIRNGRNGGGGLLINVSRGISYPAAEKGKTRVELIRERVVHYARLMAID
ncbi:MAG TPA: orotidine-5'-phosphate decarboxylase [Saprospiraceae bacterium]|nr:orotidine-5'-phosphate decarboxylase [Saprospiraceae bacterium]